MDLTVIITTAIIFIILIERVIRNDLFNLFIL
jgi:hypothetical protein